MWPVPSTYTLAMVTNRNEACWSVPEFNGVSLQPMWSPRRRVWPSSPSSKPASWSPREQAVASWSPDWLTDVRQESNTNGSFHPVYRQFGSLFTVWEKLSVFQGCLCCHAHNQRVHIAQRDMWHVPIVIWCINVNYSTGLDNSGIPAVGF